MKNNIIKNFQNFYLIIFQNYIFFGQIDQKINGCLIIKCKYALRHIEGHFDRLDPRILNLVAKDKNGSYIDISVSFDDMGKSSNIKQSIEENRKSARNTEYLLLDSYFEELVNKLKF